MISTSIVGEIQNSFRSIRSRATRNPAILLVSATMLMSAGAARAVQYDFLPVANTGTFTAQFNSLNGNGWIDATHIFSSPAAVGYGDNNDALIYPSQFTSVFPGTGLVQGNLGMTVYGHTARFEFDTSNYSITPSTVFGMWNTSDEVAGITPVYQVQLIDNTNTQVNPTTFTVYGKQDNTTQVFGRHELDMNPATGEITPGAVINGGSGVHTSATFWNNIPTGTQKIIVYADLPPLNLIGDGVGYYFAEVHVPEPASLGTLLLAAVALRRHRR